MAMSSLSSEIELNSPTGTGAPWTKWCRPARFYRGRESSVRTGAGGNPPSLDVPASFGCDVSAMAASPGPVRPGAAMASGHTVSPFLPPRPPRVQQRRIVTHSQFAFWRRNRRARGDIQMARSTTSGRWTDRWGRWTGQWTGRWTGRWTAMVCPPPPINSVQVQWEPVTEPRSPLVRPPSPGSRSQPLATGRGAYPTPCPTPAACYR